MVKEFVLFKEPDPVLSARCLHFCINRRVNLENRALKREREREIQVLASLSFSLSSFYPLDQFHSRSLAAGTSCVLTRRGVSNHQWSQDSSVPLQRSPCSDQERRNFTFDDPRANNPACVRACAWGPRSEEQIKEWIDASHQSSRKSVLCFFGNLYSPLLLLSGH